MLPNASKWQHRKSASHKARTPNRVLWNNRRKKPESAPGVMQISIRKGFCGPQGSGIRCRNVVCAKRQVAAPLFRYAHSWAARVGKDRKSASTNPAAMPYSLGLSSIRPRPLADCPHSQQSTGALLSRGWRIPLHRAFVVYSHLTLRHCAVPFAKSSLEADPFTRWLGRLGAILARTTKRAGVP